MTDTPVYNGNALYDQLEKRPQKRLLTPGKNVWALAYASNAGETKALVVVFQREAGDPIFPKHVNKRFVYACSQMAYRCGLPFRMMSFEAPTDGKPLDRFLVSDGNQAPTQAVTGQQWRNILASLGISAHVTGSMKPVNRATSSPYHDWQRRNLGAVRAVDLDLLGLDKQGQLERVIELKRSAIRPEEWTPFNSDYPNFKVVAGLCAQLQIGFDLIFNRYDKKTLVDDLSTLRVFSFLDQRFRHKTFVDGHAWLGLVKPQPASPRQGR